MLWRSLLGTALVASVILGAPAPASANPFDTWGFSSRAIGLGGAGTAAATDVDAAYYNPAAQTRATGFVVSAGLIVADDFLDIDGASADLDTHVHAQLGFATPLPLGETLRNRLFLSVAVSLPSSGLFDVTQPDDEALGAPMFDARNRRLVLMAALAGRITDWLSIGVGASLLPDVSGDVTVALASERDFNATHVEVEYDFAPTAGVLVQPLDWLAVGVTYRGAQRTTLDLPVAVDAGGLPVAARVVAPAYAQPHQVALGVDVGPFAGLRVAADVTWMDYSAFRYSSPDVTLYDEEGGIAQESFAAPVSMDDVFVPRLGLEWTALPWLLVRGGYAYIPTPFPAQKGKTNLLDADRNVISAGLGFAVDGSSLWEGAGGLAVDLHAQVAVLRDRAVEKLSVLPENPGYPTVSISGGSYSAGVSVRLWF